MMLLRYLRNIFIADKEFWSLVSTIAKTMFWLACTIVLIVTATRFLS